MTTHLTYDIHDEAMDANGCPSIPYILLKVTIGRSVSTFTYDREHVLNMWLDNIPDDVAKILAYNVVDLALRNYLENDHETSGLQMSKYIDAYEQTPEIKALTHSVYHAFKEFTDKFIDEDIPDDPEDNDPEDEDNDDLEFFVSSYDNENGMSLVISFGDIAHVIDISMSKLMNMMYYDPSHRQKMAYDIAYNLVCESLAKKAGVCYVNDWLGRHEMKQEYAKQMVARIDSQLEQLIDGIKYNKMILSEFEKMIIKHHED